MSQKNELALIREQQLAKLRGTAAEPERVTLDFACAVHDRDFRVTFARKSREQRFRCESVEKDAPRHATASEQLQGLFKPAETLRVQATEMDFTSVRCVACAGGANWTLCPHCHAMVCGGRSTPSHFTCRDSCGGRFQTVPLDALDAGRSTGTATRLAIGRQAQTLLPGKTRRK